MKFLKFGSLVVISIISLNVFAYSSKEYHSTNITPEMLSSFPQTQEWALNNVVTDWNLNNKSGAIIKVTIKVSPATMGSTPLTLRCADYHSDNKYIPAPGETITCQIENGGFVEWGSGLEGLQYSGAFTLET